MVRPENLRVEPFQGIVGVPGKNKKKSRTSRYGIQTQTIPTPVKMGYLCDSEKVEFLITIK